MGKVIREVGLCSLRMRRTSLQIQHIPRESSASVPERFVWFDRLAPRGGIIHKA